MMNSASNENIPYQCTTSACERGGKITDFNHICPSKLSKRELEDLYFSLVQNNMELKKTINRQGEKMKVMSTRLQRMSTVQKAERGKEKDCCPATKAVVKDQRESIVELKKANERLTERIRQLNMRLCSTKQFLKRPSQAGTRCTKCLMTPAPGSGKNISTSALNLRKSDANIQTSSVSCQCLDKDLRKITVEIETEISDHKKEAKSPRSDEEKSDDRRTGDNSQNSRYMYPAYRPVEVKSIERIYNEKGQKRRDSKAKVQQKSKETNDKEKDSSPAPSPRSRLNSGSKEQRGERSLKSTRPVEKSSERDKEATSKETQYRGVSQKSCDDNRCRTLMEELKQKIANLQEEHTDYSTRISRLEEEVIELHSENLRLVSDSAARAHSLERRERDARDVAGRLRDAEAQSGDLSTQLAIEKSKVSELETQVKAASMSGQVARAIEGHLAKKRSKSPHVSEGSDGAHRTSVKTSPIRHPAASKGSKSARDNDNVHRTSVSATKAPPIRQSTYLKESKLPLQNNNYDSNGARSESAPASIVPTSLPPATSKDSEPGPTYAQVPGVHSELQPALIEKDTKSKIECECDLYNRNAHRLKKSKSKVQCECCAAVGAGGAGGALQLVSSAATSTVETPPTQANTVETTAPIVAESMSTAPIVAESMSTAPIVAESMSTAPIVAESMSTAPIVAESMLKKACVSGKQSVDGTSNGTRRVSISSDVSRIGVPRSTPATAPTASITKSPCVCGKVNCDDVDRRDSDVRHDVQKWLQNIISMDQDEQPNQKESELKKQMEKEEEYEENRNKHKERRLSSTAVVSRQASGTTAVPALVPEAMAVSEPKPMEPCVCGVRTDDETEGARRLSSRIDSDQKTAQALAALTESESKRPTEKYEKCDNDRDADDGGGLRPSAQVTPASTLGVSEMVESSLGQGCYDDSGYAESKTRDDTNQNLAMINEQLMERIAYLQGQLSGLGVIAKDLQSTSKDASPERSMSKKRNSEVDPDKDKHKNPVDASNHFKESDIKRAELAIGEYILSDTKIPSTTNSLKENVLKIEDAHNRYQIPGPLPVSSNRDSIASASRRMSNLSSGSRRNSRSQKEKKDDRDNSRSTKSVVLADDSLNFVFKDNKIVLVDFNQSKTTDNQAKDKETPDDDVKEEEERRYFLNDIDSIQTQDRDDKPKHDLDYCDDIASIQTQAKDANNLTEPIETKDLYQYIDSIQIRAKVETKTAKDNAKAENKKPDFYDDIDSVQSGIAKIESIKSDNPSLVSEAKDTRDILPQRPTDASDQVHTVTESPLSLYIPPTLPGSTPYEAESEQATELEEDNQLDICERMTHVCTCPHGARRDVAVFRSCSGTLRFRTTSASASKFRRCKCCRKPPKMITCGTQAEVEDDSPSDQDDIHADLSNAEEPQDFPIQFQESPQGQPTKSDRNVEVTSDIDRPKRPLKNQKYPASQMNQTYQPQVYTPETKGKTRQQPFQPDRKSHDSRLFYEYHPKTTSDRTRNDEIDKTFPPRMSRQDQRSQADQIDVTRPVQISRRDQKSKNDQMDVAQPRTSRQERKSQDFRIDEPSSRRKRTSQDFQTENDDQPPIPRRDQRSQENLLDDFSQRRLSRRDRKSEDSQMQPRTLRPEIKLQPDPILPSQTCNVGTFRGSNEQMFQEEKRRQQKRCMIDEEIQAYAPCDDELEEQPLRQFDPPSASSSQPRTYIIRGSAEVVKCTRGTSSENTDYDVSSMVSEKAQNSSQTAPLSPGEKRASISSATDSYTMTMDHGQLSEGELPAEGGKKLSSNETPTKDKPPDANPGGGGRGSDSSQKMEEALAAIGEELARCRQLLMSTKRQRESQESRDAAATADLRPSGPIALRKSDGKARIVDAFIPKCIFTLHIGTIVLSDEAVINSRDMTLVLTWKFHDQSVSMTRMLAGRVVHFDFSTEYDVNLTDEFLDYLKHEEMSIRICEVDRLDEPFASCSLPLRDALLHTNRRADMSLALVSGPRMRRARTVADALDAGDEVGVLDLWCLLRAEPRMLAHINRAIAKSGGGGSARPSAAGAVMAQVREDDQDEYRLSNDLDFVCSAKRSIRYSDDGSSAPGSIARSHPEALLPGARPCRLPPDHLAAPASLITGPGSRIDGFNAEEAKYHDYPPRGQVSFENQESRASSGIIINEVPANIKSTREMNTALERSRNYESLLRKPRDGGLRSPSMLSVKSLLARHGAPKEKRQRLSLSDYANASTLDNDTGSWKIRPAPVRDETPKGSECMREGEDSDNTVENKKYDNNKLMVTKKALDAFKRVKIRQKREPSYFQSEPTKGQSIDITVLWLALSEECDAMLDPCVQRLYVAYSFLGRDGAELETPASLPKPKQYQDKCFFDFKQTFQLSDSDMPRVGRLAHCRSPAKGAPSARDCVVFTVVSEPTEDPLALHDCEDIGRAHLYLGDLLAYSADSDSYTEVLPVLVASGSGAVCGVLAVKVDGLDVVRQCLMMIDSKAYSSSQLFW